MSPLPWLPVRDVPAAVFFYARQFGFHAEHATADAAVVARGECRLQLRRGAEPGDFEPAAVHLPVADFAALALELVGPPRRPGTRRAVVAQDQDGNVVTFVAAAGSA